MYMSGYVIHMECKQVSSQQDSSKSQACQSQQAIALSDRTT